MRATVPNTGGIIDFVKTAAARKRSAKEASLPDSSLSPAPTQAFCHTVAQILHQRAQIASETKKLQQLQASAAASLTKKVQATAMTPLQLRPLAVAAARARQHYKTKLEMLIYEIQKFTRPEK
jgi:predicted flavoprotein YhiN